MLWVTEVVQDSFVYVHEKKLCVYSQICLQSGMQPWLSCWLSPFGFHGGALRWWTPVQGDTGSLESSAEEALVKVDSKTSEIDQLQVSCKQMSHFYGASMWGLYRLGRQASRGLWMPQNVAQMFKEKCRYPVTLTKIQWLPRYSFTFMLEYLCLVDYNSDKKDKNVS